LANNTKKYRYKLTRDEIFAVERNAFKELSHFGYALENDLDKLRQASTELSFRKRMKYYFSEKSRMISVGLGSILSDKNAYLRLRKRFFVWGLRATL